MVADTINMIYEQLKTATVSSIKDKSFETVFIFYLLHSLVDNNIIMLDKFVETINEHLENIKNIYKEENVELNFDKELEVLNNILEDSKTPIEKKIKESRKNKDKKKNQSKDNQSKDNQSKDSNIINLSNFRKK